MQLYIIRHGDPDYANDTLTAAGQLEAAALATRMARHIRPDELYSSPLGRARATMRPTEEALRQTGTILDWAGELSLWTQEGPWGARQAHWDVPGDWVRNASPLPAHDTWHRQSPFDEPAVQEDFARVRAASDGFLVQLGYERQGGRYACVAPHRRKIAVFCHGGLGLTWLAHLLEIPLSLMWSGFWLPPSSVTTLLLDERSAAWATPRCIGLGDLSHLYAESLERSNMGLKANLT
jgi:broad specificity phosphatase PhoE